MSYRVQFSITSDEYELLQKIASNKGFPTISSYCKSIVLPNAKNINMRKMSEIIDIAISNISKMPIKDCEGNPYEFYLRDLYPNPPSSLGTHINKMIDSVPSSLPILRRSRQDRTGTWMYTRTETMLSD